MHDKRTCEERTPGCIGFTNGCRCPACMGTIEKVRQAEDEQAIQVEVEDKRMRRLQATYDAGLPTPIELLLNALDKYKVTQGDVLLPEQCAEIYMGEKRYHVTIEEMEK